MEHRLNICVKMGKEEEVEERSKRETGRERP